MSVEILGTVIGVLGFIVLITWRFWPIVEQIQRERREEPFGSKGWHWPAVAFLGLLVIVSILLRLHDTQAPTRFGSGLDPPPATEIR